MKENVLLLKDLLGRWKTKFLSIAYDSCLKNLYFDVLDDIVNKYNNTVRRSIKIKPIDVKSYAENNEDSNVTKPKSKIGDHARISKYKNIFDKECTQYWWEEVFVVSQIKSTVPRTHVSSDLNGEPIARSFSENELKKTNQKEFRTEKVIKTICDKLYVKWKGYDNSFSSWIDKKDLWVNTFLSRLEDLAEILTLKLIFKIMLQKPI